MGWPVMSMPSGVRTRTSWQFLLLFTRRCACTSWFVQALCFWNSCNICLSSKKPLDSAVVDSSKSQDVGIPVFMLSKIHALLSIFSPFWRHLARIHTLSQAFQVFSLQINLHPWNLKTSSSPLLINNDVTPSIIVRFPEPPNSYSLTECTLG